MCDVCRSTGIDATRINGAKTSLSLVTIWNQFDDVVQIKTCYFHGVEIFLLGEKRFFAAYPELEIDISVNKNKYTDISLGREA